MYDFLKAIGATGADVTVRFVTGGTTLRDLVRDASAFDRVVASGGDGTVTGVCYALRGSGVPILAYPAGTANLLALNLKMPVDPEQLASIALSDKVLDLDIGELTVGDSGTPDRRVEGFMVGAGAGFDASIMEGAQDLKQSIGSAAYLVGALANLTPTVSRFTLQLDGNEIETEGIAVLVANVARLPFDLPLIHESDPSDGRFEVVVLRTRNAIELLPAVWAAIVDRMTGQHAGRSAGVETHVASSIRVHVEPALPMQFDGEVLPANPSFEIEVLPRAARLLVPSESVLR
jgi:diacylglycerol kinase family enzyme